MNNSTFRLSPNCDERRAGRGPEGVIIHATAGRSLSGDVEWCCNPDARVSYHYIVGRAGAVVQLVPERLRAWHAGKSRWLGKDDCNDFTIGVALSYHPDEGAYPEAQLAAAAALVADILKRRGLHSDRIAGHADVATPAGRKTDPYHTFDWTDFRVRVLFHLHPPPEPDVIDLLQAA